MTDRQINFEFVAPERRPHLQKFVARLAGEQPAASAAASTPAPEPSVS